MRALALQVFETIGLPEQALPFVLAELETAHDAEALVAAARALRGWSTPTSDVQRFLDRAFETALTRDDFVHLDLDDPNGDVGSSRTRTTATAELNLTQAWLEERTAARSTSSCCAPLSEHARGIRRIVPSRRRAPQGLEAVRFEDERRQQWSFADVCVGQPTVVAFFYTRCENPRKCSLTIAKLAQLERGLGAMKGGEQARVVAISYDPSFDTAERLAAFGRARGFGSSPSSRLLRAFSGMEALAGFFSLGVAYVRKVVARHRIELFLLDEKGRVAAVFEHVEWSPAEVQVELARLLEADRGRTPKWRGLVGALPALGLAALPKCPMCWMAYSSAFGIAGLERFARFGPGVLGLLIGVNVTALTLRALRTGRYLPFAIALAGAAFLLLGSLWPGARGASVVGAGLFIVAALIGPLSGGRRRTARSEPAYRPSYQ